ncbi:NUDIX hydrolase [Caldalkalibacillus mannanilyticus]|uniref:NUDIX hydrolase n=1 Tax=Caldalkalibacillus mannanilyticus TaxID=1418 RepID=UPI000686A162|nr:8-oxo-dGTP diphosphatase [Caldalkalibacillus mannanilyticus]
MEIKFTLCFIRYQNEFLMLFRNKAPNKNKWNGVGGKIEAEETPLHSCQREIQEETGLHIDLRDIHFRGVVTWNHEGGMYVFVARSDTPLVVSGQEGKLEWKSLSWIMDSGLAVSNIPLFLPYMLEEENEPVEFAFTYNQQEEVVSYQVIPDSTYLTPKGEERLEITNDQK